MTFDDFWKLYPRKVAKAEALKAWGKVSEEDRVKAVEALPNHCRLWDDKDKQYIPHAATWLRGLRWEDEIETQKPKLAPVQAWWTTEQGTLAYGASKGIHARPGEGMSEYRERLKRA